jgi:hypothetical protein
MQKVTPRNRQADWPPPDGLNGLIGLDWIEGTNRTGAVNQCGAYYPQTFGRQARATRLNHLN